MATWQSGKRAGCYVLVDCGRILARVERDPVRPRVWRARLFQSPYDQTPFPSRQKAMIVAQGWAGHSGAEVVLWKGCEVKKSKKSDAAVRWRREMNPASGGSCYRVYNDGGEVVLHVHKQANCGFWYVFVGEGQDEADGSRFNRLWEAKQYAERQIQNGRVSLEAETLTCAECLEEFPREECLNGVCDECSREECPSCEGSGYSDHYDDEDGLQECEDCGGDGVV